jgi:hypothetical protein
MTTTRQKAPSILTEIGARRLTARIRDALAVADDLLAQAYQGRAWEALGYDSWAEYCSKELPELRHLKMRAEARRERVRALLAEGASRREMAAATGADVATVHRDVVFIEGRTVANATPVEDSPAEVEPDLPKTEQVVRLVAAQAEKGMTCLEIEHEMGWRHGVASGPVSRMAAPKRHRIVPSGRFREGYTVYVTP